MLDLVSGYALRCPFYDAYHRTPRRISSTWRDVGPLFPTQRRCSLLVVASSPCSSLRILTPHCKRQRTRSFPTATNGILPKNLEQNLTLLPSCSRTLPYLWTPNRSHPSNATKRQCLSCKWQIIRSLNATHMSPSFSMPWSTRTYLDLRQQDRRFRLVGRQRNHPSTFVLLVDARVDDQAFSCGNPGARMSPDWDISILSSGGLPLEMIK